MELRTANLELPEPLTPVYGGGVTSARGFSASGVHAGFRAGEERPDLALVVVEEPCAAAGVFTRNAFCAAPVSVCREHLGTAGYGRARAVLINSGNANAACGKAGMDAARTTAHWAADLLGCKDGEVLVASTGVIGVHLPLEPFESALPAAVAALGGTGGTCAARAIMTTDTYPKEYAVSYISEAPGYEGRAITVGGMAKGSGMIMPDMATMIAVLTTDAPLAPATAHAALVSAVGTSFNKVTVDSDTSTNDTCLLLASGKAQGAQGEGAGAPIQAGTAAFEEFTRALGCVCTALARAIASDGEGATRLITVTVTQAATERDADLAARAIANSPLVKTAVFGHDANWGRIAMALGKSGAVFSPEDVSIDIMGVPVCRAGLTVGFDEDEALHRFEQPEIAIAADLGAGPFSATVWTCDLTHGYVTINGEYRT